MVGWRVASLALPRGCLAPVAQTRDARPVFDRIAASGFLACGVLLICTACVAPPQPAGNADPAGAAPVGRSVATLRIIESDVTVRVYRDGPLAHLGHNHVISSTGVAGQVVLREPLEASSFSLSLPLDSLVVDDPARRSEAGADFPDNLTESDREGTRRNLFGPALLDAARFPVLHLDSEGIERSAGGYLARVRVDAAGIRRVVRFPVTIRRDGSGLSASGSVVLTHADLGLVPFSAALGALRVREDLEIAYRLVARGDAS